MTRILFSAAYPPRSATHGPAKLPGPWVADVDMDSGELLTSQYPGHELKLSSMGFAACHGVILMAYNPDTQQKSILLTHYGPMDYAVEKNFRRLDTLLRELDRRQGLAASEIRLGLYVPDDRVYRQRPPESASQPSDPLLVQKLRSHIETAVGRFVETQVIPYDPWQNEAGTLDVSTKNSPAAPFKILVQGQDETRRFYPSA